MIGKYVNLNILCVAPFSPTRLCDARGVARVRVNIQSANFLLQGGLCFFCLFRLRFLMITSERKLYQLGM